MFIFFKVALYTTAFNLLILNSIFIIIKLSAIDNNFYKLTFY